MRTRVKVCCIQSVAEARLAVAMGADALGLVGEMPSGPDPIADEAISGIARRAPPAVATFLLTSRTSPGAVVLSAARAEIDGSAGRQRHGCRSSRSSSSALIANEKCTGAPPPNSR